MNQPYIVKMAMIPSRLLLNRIVAMGKRRQILESDCQFFTKLEEHILQFGFRNPINVWTNSSNKPFHDVRYGGSRLEIAQKHGLDIPCIISDWDDYWNGIVLNTTEDILEYFADHPSHIRWGPRGIDMRGCADVHLGYKYNTCTTDQELLNGRRKYREQ